MLIVKAQWSIYEREEVEEGLGNASSYDLLGSHIALTLTLDHLLDNLHVMCRSTTNLSHRSNPTLIGLI